MIYKGFALSVLIGAPLVVVAVQSLLPPPQPAVKQAEAAPQTGPPMVAPVPPTLAYAPPPAPEAIVPAGQPMAGAGQPMLVPGSTPSSTPPVAESPAAVEAATPPVPMNF